MNKVFQHLLRNCLLVFFDDILVFSPSWQAHLHHLEEVLQLLVHHGLFAKVSKCQFKLTEIEYLGHIVLGVGVAMEGGKVQIVLD